MPRNRSEAFCTALNCYRRSLVTGLSQLSYSTPEGDLRGASSLYRNEWRLSSRTAPTALSELLVDMFLDGAQFHDPPLRDGVGAHVLDLGDAP
jgi:hypothetical protein